MESELRIREAFCELLLGNFAVSERLLREVSEAAIRRGDELILGKVELQRGTLHFCRRNWGASRASYKAALEIADKSQLTSLHISASTGIAKAVRESRGYVEALPLFKEAWVKANELGNKILLALLEGELGHCQCFLGELDEAEQHLERALAIDKEVGTEAYEHIHFADMGNVWLRRNRIDKAVEYFQKALAGAEKVNNRWCIMRWSYNLAIVNLQLEDFSEAQRFLGGAYRLSVDSGDQYYQSLCLTLSARINSGMAAVSVGQKDGGLRAIFRR